MLFRSVYRTGSGFGVRLDGGNGFTGAVISPYYDSLLVKTTTWARSFEDAIRKSLRSMKELTISGVKTNVGFLINVLNHPTFVEGKCTTNFIEENDELFKIFTKTDREYNLLKYIGEKVVNETFGVKKEFDVPVIPKVIVPDGLKGTKQILDEKGPKGLVEDRKSVV